MWKNAFQIASAFFPWFPQAQQLTDLEQKLSAAKDKLENAALDKVSKVSCSVSMFTSVSCGCLGVICQKTNGSLAHSFASELYLGVMLLKSVELIVIREVQCICKVI